ncbi:MAG: hypothetical protein PVH68_07340 [Armatimonadota bacterium]|jgi:hypothetical protein
MPRHEDTSDELLACAWCTQRVRRSVTGTAARPSAECPMCGRPMYPLPTTFAHVARHAPPPTAAVAAEVLSRA